MWVQFVRQFSILDADDDYERMEQLRCRINLDGSQLPDDPGSGSVWAGAYPLASYEEVERSRGFVGLQAGKTIELTVEHATL